MPVFGSSIRLLFIISWSLIYRPAEGGVACLSNPCVHGVCLDNLNSSYFCYCVDGYTGIQCQTNWDECWSSPCQNGGICLDGIASYNCTCPPGFVGDLCEVDFNECESNPCWNNGTCLDGTNGYVCNCLPGYSGTHCEIDVSVCNTTNETRCSNGGLCQEGPGESFTCMCQQGWRGTLCEEEVDECQSAPCQNGGVCIDLLADYSCACPFGFAGKNCEEAVHICRVNPCLNGAICLLEDGHSVCYCVPDFHGDLCQYQYDECQLGPSCLNGGKCIDGIAKSTCSCPPELTGVRCECLILENNDLDCTYVSPTTTTETTQKSSSTLSTITTSAVATERITTTPATTVPTTITTTTTEEATEVPTIITTQILNNYSTTEFTTISTLVPTTAELTVYTQSETTYTTIPPTAEQTTTTLGTTTSGAESTFAADESTTLDISTTEFATITTESHRDVSDFFTQTLSTVSTISTGFTTLIPETSTTSEQTTHMITETPTTPVTATMEQNFSSTIFDQTTSYTSSITTFLTKEPDTAMTTFQFVSTSELPVPIDCNSEIFCLNGGTCIYSKERGYHCICPFGTDGISCEIQLGIKQAAFTGDSYLSHKLGTSPNISLEFEAKTLATDGLWVYCTLDQAYIALYMKNGYLKFKFSCGYQTMLLSEINVPVNNGYLTRVKIALDFSKDLKHCEALIKVNDSLSMAGDQIAVINQLSKPTQLLYLGGVPPNLPKDNVPSVGFTGCMMNLKISGKRASIFKDALDGFKITECSSLACLSNPCRHGATCFSKGDEWFCNCKNGYLGKHCEVSVCDNNPCLFGGTCMPFSGSGYICLCPFGKHGHLCESDIQILKPNFSSGVRGLSSYIAYPIPEGISESMELRFRFIPTMMDQISILMFIGQKGPHDFYSDHMAVSFVKGYIMLTWNLGSGPRRIFTTQPIPKGVKDYSVRLGRFGRRAWLYVENLKNVTGRSPGNLIQLDVLPILYLGGFSGCIYDVQLISGNVIIPLQGSKQTIGRAVGQCGASECHEQSCQNRGACLHHGSTFTCLCQDAWFDPLCSSKRNPCDSTNHKCAAGSTCVPFISNYECDCPTGKWGKYCEKDFPQDAIDVGFTGKRSFISLAPLAFKEKQFTVEMEIRTLMDDGLLLFIGRSESGFISVSLQNGFLEMKLLPGGNRADIMEPITISSCKLLVKGVWYKLRLGVFGKRMFLSVDNTTDFKILQTDRTINFSTENVFLGGLPDVSQLPPLATSKLPMPYKGCLRHLFYNSEHIALTKENVVNGRNINHCDGSPCSKEACLNGGTCWLDSFMKPHCYCVPPYYGPKCELIPSCDGNLCKNMGKCDDTKCYCKVGWNGAFCENQITVTVPEFSTGSYLIMEKIGDKKRNIQHLDLKSLYLNFTTVKKEGLLVWNKKGDSFIGLGIDKGCLKIAYTNSLNKNQFHFLSQATVSDGLWHTVHINFARLRLKLDDDDIFYKEKQDKHNNNATLILNGSLYIGGIPTKLSISKETNGIFSSHFEGCIEAFAINDEQTVRDFTIFDGSNIDTCNLL